MVATSGGVEFTVLCDLIRRRGQFSRRERAVDGFRVADLSKLDRLPLIVDVA